MIRTVCIELTRECNLSCPFCHASSNENTDPAICLTAEQWKEAINKFPSLQFLNITGGEALLPSVWPKTLAITRYAADKGIKVKLNTNGTHIQDLEDIPVNLVRFQVSIDGPEKVHDKLRGKGVYQKALKFLEHYHALGHTLEIKGVIVDPDDAQAVIDNAAELAERFGVLSTFQTMAPFGRGKSLEDKANKKRPEIKSKVMKKGRSFLKEEVKVCKGHLGAGGTFADIDEEGYFIPCSQLRHLRTDVNILDPDYSEIKARLAIKRLAQGLSCSC